MLLPQTDIIDTSAKGLAQFAAASFPVFDSLAEAIKRGESAPLNSKFEAVSKEDGDYRKKFTGSASWPAMQSIVDEGWTKGRAIVAASLETIFASGAAQISSGAAIDYDIAGHYPDAALAASGESFAMVNAGDLTAEKPIIKLMINISASCGISAAKIANRGAAVAALVDEIESAGNSCEVYAVEPAYANRNGKKSLYCPCIALKRAGEVLGIDELAFGLGHPSMLRRVCFALTETDPFTNDRGFASAYGFPTDIPADALPHDAIYLRGIDKDKGKYGTPSEAMETVRSIYERQATDKGLVEVQS